MKKVYVTTDRDIKFTEYFEIIKLENKIISCTLDIKSIKEELLKENIKNIPLDDNLYISISSIHVARGRILNIHNEKEFLNLISGTRYKIYSLVTTRRNKKYISKLSIQKHSNLYIKDIDYYLKIYGFQFCRDYVWQKFHACDISLERCIWCLLNNQLQYK